MLNRGARTMESLFLSRHLHRRRAPSETACLHIHVKECARSPQWPVGMARMAPWCQNQRRWPEWEERWGKAGGEALEVSERWVSSASRRWMAYSASSSRLETPELPVDAGQVVLDRLLADRELAGHVLVAQPTHDGGDDLQLARGEAGALAVVACTAWPPAAGTPRGSPPPRGPPSTGRPPRSGCT